MQRLSINEIPYEIPAQGIYVRESLWKSEENRSKYFDLRKDIQAGLHLGNMDELEQEYLDEVCGGVPWETEQL